MSISTLVSKQQSLAQQALIETVPADHIGQFIDVTLAEAIDNVVLATYNFSCASTSYPGWYWSVVVVAIDGQDYCTVSEINLLPGAQALVPDAWTPWAQRVEPGDLGVGDLLPPPENDVRLTAGFTGLDELAEDMSPLHPAQWELGLGREKILSDVGMQQAAERWMAGQTGPRSAMAKAAPASCSTCGYLIALGGSLGQVFGMCGNEFGAADGQIVAMSFGCGAHSSVVVAQATPIPVVDLVVDDISDDQSPVEHSDKVEPEVHLLHEAVDDEESAIDLFGDDSEDIELDGDDADDNFDVEDNLREIDVDEYLDRNSDDSVDD